jgi:hypothetical protein
VSSGDTTKGEAIAGCVDYAVDVAKTMKYDLGEFTFALVDCASAWKIDHAYGAWHLAGTVCDLEQSFELTWTGPDAGGVVLVTPDGAGGGSFTLTGQLVGLPTSGSGPIRIDSGADPPTVFMGAGSWLVESPAGAVSVSGAEDVTMPLIAGAGPDCD